MSKTKDRAKAILSNHRCGSQVTGPNKDWLLEQMATCSRLKTMATEPGAKVKVAMAKGRFRYKTFFIMARDKTLPAPVSWWAKTSKPLSNRAKVMQACRDLVQDQIKDYRDQFWERYTDSVERAKKAGLANPPAPLCPVSRKPLHSGATHVDHNIVPFVDLVLNWCEANQLDINSLATVYRKGRRFVSNELNTSWQEYHRAHAQLQLLRAKANLNKGASQRVKRCRKPAG